jgi:hypothetical protein
MEGTYITELATLGTYRVRVMTVAPFSELMIESLSLNGSGVDSIADAGKYS